jgi:hypothetical protein
MSNTEKSGEKSKGIGLIFMNFIFKFIYAIFA